MNATATQRGKIITCSDRKGSSEEVCFFLQFIINVSLLSGRIKDEKKALDVKVHFNAPDVYFLATTKHNLGGRYFSFSDRVLQKSENKNAVVLAHILAKSFIAFLLVSRVCLRGSLIVHIP